MSDDTLRRPTDEEQAIIAYTFEMMAKVEGRRFAVAGVGMGPEIIEDVERGRWVTMLGKPVYEVRGENPRVIVLLVEIRLPAGSEGAMT